LKIAAVYSFNNGKKVIDEKYPDLLKEVLMIIKSIDATKCKTKTSKEKTMPGKILFSPRELNIAFSKQFFQFGWQKYKVSCDYPTQYYTVEHCNKLKNSLKGAYREMDFVKNKFGVEVQFGKYSFMVYNVAAKMTIFRNLGIIDAGLEIVPVKQFADDMSTGVSYFEQFVWDLEKRGVSNIDIPVLIFGVDADN
jgi:hypothetical protein